MNIKFFLIIIKMLYFIKKIHLWRNIFLLSLINFIFISSCYATEFIDFDTIIISNNTKGQVTLSPHDNRLSCTSTSGDIACNPMGQRATIQLYGGNGETVQIYCPKTVRIKVKNYGQMDLANITVAPALVQRNFPCLDMVRPTLRLTVKKNTNLNYIYVGGTLVIDNVQRSDSSATYFNITIVYQ